MSLPDEFLGSRFEDELPPAMPWDQTPSIYQHICRHVNPGQKFLREGGEALPDEEHPEG